MKISPDGRNACIEPVEMPVLSTRTEHPHWACRSVSKCVEMTEKVTFRSDTKYREYDKIKIFTIIMIQIPALNKPEWQVYSCFRHFFINFT